MTNQEMIETFCMFAPETVSKMLTVLSDAEVTQLFESVKAVTAFEIQDALLGIFGEETFENFKCKHKRQTIINAAIAKYDEMSRVESDFYDTYDPEPFTE